MKLVKKLQQDTICSQSNNLISRFVCLLYTAYLPLVWTLQAFLFLSCSLTIVHITLLSKLSFSYLLPVVKVIIKLKQFEYLSVNLFCSGCHFVNEKMTNCAQVNYKLCHFLLHSKMVSICDNIFKNMRPVYTASLVFWCRKVLDKSLLFSNDKKSQ